MSKPRITAQHDIPATEHRVLCQPSPVHKSAAVEVRVEFDKGDHESARALLEQAMESVLNQITESTAPTWDGPRKVGEE